MVTMAAIVMLVAGEYEDRHLNYPVSGLAGDNGDARHASCVAVVSALG
jgi:hypothetical protein